MDRKKIVFSPILIFILVGIIIPLIWFKKGLLFATAEEGPVFYSLVRTAEIYGSSWIRWGTGFGYALGLPMAFSAKIFSGLSLIFSNVQIQFAVFTLLIFSAVCGMYFLTLKLTKNKLISFAAALFYFLNLYSMSQIWRRALFMGIFSWSFLPLYTYLFIKWIEERQLKYLLYYVACLLLFLWSFTNVSYVFCFIASSFSYLTYLFIDEKKILKIKRFSYALVFVLVTFIINIWWIYPLISTANYTYGAYSGQSNLESLSAVSNSFPLGEIFLLRQKGYFDLESNPLLPALSWGTWYDNIFPRLISVCIFLVVIFGWVSSKNSKYWIFLSLLAFVGLFVSKGTNPPFGFSFFGTLFTKLPFMAVLRNSYEKFGLVWLLPYSVFFGYGLFELYTLSKTIYKKVILIFFTLLVYGVLVWPIWTGKLFEENFWVKVPQSYETLNQYLNEDNEDVKIAVLPLVPDHGASFSWNYHGTEPSEFFFDKVTLSKKNKADLLYSNKYEELRKTIEQKGNPEKILNELNIKYLILRNDLESENVGALSFEETEESISGFENIKYVLQDGGLKLYMFTLDKPGFIAIQGNESVDLTYHRENSDKYTIYIKNAHKSYNLIFKETYNDKWKLLENGKEIGRHYIAYGYANGWEIEKSGDYILEMVFKVWPWD